MTRRILVIVPNVLRDLEGHALMGYHLSKCYGHEVRYTIGTNLTRELLEFAPDAVVMDHLSWDYRARQALLVKKIGAKLVLLPTSGLFRDMSEHELIAGRAFHVNGLLDCYLAWSEQARLKLLASGLLTEGQVRSVGSPRFDFYSVPYTSLIGDRQTLLEGLGVQNAAAPLVVWAPGNVGFAAVGPAALKRWKVGTNVDPGFFQDEMVDVLDQYNEHAPLVVELARRRPGWSVVVKVHPGDQLSRFLWMCERAANIRVVQAVSIRELLVHCDALLQRCSTAANEAWMLGKPVLSLGTTREVLKISQEYTAGNTTVRTLDELVEATDGFLGDPRIPQEQERARAAFIEATYFRVDGRSGERCAAAVHELVSAPAHSDADHEKIRATALAVRPDYDRVDIARATTRLKSMIGLKPSRSLRFWRWPSRRSAEDERKAEATGISGAAVEALYAQFARVHGTCRKRWSRPGGEGLPVAEESQPVQK
jgi:surface carbohydrate biosynthesis protein